MATNGVGTANADDWGKLVLRVTLGGLMLFHGIAKISGGPGSILALVSKAGLPETFGYLVYLGEVIAPLLVIAGIWTRAAAVIIAGNMVVAVALVHMHEVFALSNSGGWAIELQGWYFFAAVAVALLGAGRISIGGIRGLCN